jgi:vacuolar-type H+-ATPase subunit I/STV1
MKRIILTFSLIATMFAMSCESGAHKVADAENKVADAEQNLDKVKHDADSVALRDAELDAFKVESENKIKENEQSIITLKAQKKSTGKKVDAMFEKSIDTLEMRNTDMKKRMDAFERSKSDWGSFKREFNHDMTELGKALNDLTVNNKK